MRIGARFWLLWINHWPSYRTGPLLLLLCFSRNILKTITAKEQRRSFDGILTKMRTNRKRQQHLPCPRKSRQTHPCRLRFWVKWEFPQKHQLPICTRCLFQYQHQRLTRLPPFENPREQHHQPLQRLSKDHPLLLSRRRLLLLLPMHPLQRLHQLLPRHLRQHQHQLPISRLLIILVPWLPICGR